MRAAVTRVLQEGPTPCVLRTCALCAARWGVGDGPCVLSVAAHTHSRNWLLRRGSPRDLWSAIAKQGSLPQADTPVCARGSGRCARRVCHACGGCTRGGRRRCGPRHRRAQRMHTPRPLTSALCHPQSPTLQRSRASAPPRTLRATRLAAPSGPATISHTWSRPPTA